MDVISWTVTALVVAGILYAGWWLLAEKRIERIQGNRKPVKKKKERKGQPTKVADVASLGTVERKLALAGFEPNPGPFAVKLLAGTLAGALVASIPGGTLPAAAALVGIPLATWLVLGSKGKKRTRKFEEQLSQAERQIAENLRSGLSVTRSIKTVADQAEEPLRGQFESVYNEVSYSDSTLPEALAGMARRTANADVEMLATIIRIQQETGSDLASSLESLADTLAKRTKMRNELEISLSEIKMTIKIVAAMPAVAFAFTWFCYEGYDEFYSQPTGMAIIAGVAVIELVTVLILNKMADIKLD